MGPDTNTTSKLSLSVSKMKKDVLAAEDDEHKKALYAKADQYCKMYTENFIFHSTTKYC